MAEENHVYLSLRQIGTAVLAVCSAWFIFWCPFLSVVNVILALIANAVVLLILTILTRAKPEWRLETTDAKRAAIWGFALVLGLAAPAVLYWWTIHSTELLIEEIGLDVQQIDYEIRLIDNLDFGNSPMRRIYARYQVVEPLETAIGKISMWSTQQTPAWRTTLHAGKRIDGVTNELDAVCDPGSPNTGNGIHFISVWSDGQITLMIRFAAAPQACGLPSNPFNYWVYSGY